jgi:hypothetical protein
MAKAAYHGNGNGVAAWRSISINQSGSENYVESNIWQNESNENNINNRRHENENGHQYEMAKMAASIWRKHQQWRK